MIVNGHLIAPGELLMGADLRGANLRGVNLRGADLGGADLRGADLGGADLRQATLGSADLRQANLSGANLEGAWMEDADLRNANLTGTIMRGVNLIYVDHHVTDLIGAKLHDCLIPSQFYNLIPKVYARIDFKVDLGHELLGENFAIFLNLIVDIASMIGITKREDLIRRLHKDADGGVAIILEAIERTERTEDILQMMADAALSME